VVVAVELAAVGAEAGGVIGFGGALETP